MSVIFLFSIYQKKIVSVKHIFIKNSNSLKEDITNLKSSSNSRGRVDFILKRNERIINAQKPFEHDEEVAAKIVINVWIGRFLHLHVTATRSIQLNINIVTDSYPNLEYQIMSKKNKSTRALRESGLAANNAV